MIEEQDMEQPIIESNEIDDIEDIDVDEVNEEQDGTEDDRDRDMDDSENDVENEIDELVEEEHELPQPENETGLELLDYVFGWFIKSYILTSIITCHTWRFYKKLIKMNKTKTHILINI